MAMSIEDITRLLIKRDNISYNEARYLVEECQRELDSIISHGGSYEEAADVINDLLSLEPDYLSILLDEFF